MSGDFAWTTLTKGLPNTMNARFTSVSIAAALLVTLPLTAFAAPQDSMGKMGKMSKMQKMSGPVYVCKECKQYTTGAMAKKMKMMDPMGHKLVKMDKAPAGYTMMKMDKMGGMKMGGKMDKMEGKPMGGTR